MRLAAVLAALALVVGKSLAAPTMQAAIGVLTSHGTGVTIAVGTVTKHAANPLFVQDRPWESTNGGSINNGYPNVIRTATGYSLWYGICTQGCSHQIVGYANSSDGLTWTKPNLGIFSDWAKNNREDLDGTANNIVMQGGGVGVYLDEHDPDASRRYKGFGGTEGRNAKQSAVGACFGPGGSSGCIGGGTGTSPDGLHWSNAKAVTWPSPQRYDCHNNLYYDAANKSYVATTRDGFSGALGRTIGMTRSVPGTFSFDTAASPPMIEHGDKDHQLYSQVTWLWRGVYLGIVMVFDAIPLGKPGYDGSKVRRSTLSLSLSFHVSESDAALISNAHMYRMISTTGALPVELRQAAGGPMELGGQGWAGRR